MPLLQDYLSTSAARAPEKVALTCGKSRLMYRELEQRSSALAQTLIAHGVERGDRVLVFADNTPETVVSFWAALKADAVVTIVNPLTKADKLQYLIDDCRPAAMITDAHLQHVWSTPATSPHLRIVVVSGELRAETPHGACKLVPWEAALSQQESRASVAGRNLDIDLASIVYTSGSTGEAKGVMLTHRNMLTAATSVSGYLDLREDDVIVCVLPLAFDYGLYQMIMAVRQGARLVLERSFAFPAQVLQTMIAERVTVFPGVPTIFAMLAQLRTLAEYDFSNIRMVTNTAAALPAKHIDLLRQIFKAAKIFSMYGLTECKRCTYLPPEDIDRKAGSVGIAIPNTELWIVDENNQKVGPDVVGELVIRGATVMRGYWEKPEATARRLKPGPLPGEQVLYTGDYCRLDRDGYVYFVSRMDDVLKCRGEKVAPKEVELVLYDIPGVREAAVIGVPDELLGQAVKAFVVLDQGVTLTDKDIQRACMEKLENFMVPKFVSFVPELPKTGTGKIKKTDLV